MIPTIRQLIFPNSCTGCQGRLLTTEQWLCSACISNLPLTNYQLMKDNPVQKLFWGKLPIEEVWPYCYYVKGEKMQRILHAIKYKNAAGLAEKMGELFGLELLQSNTPKADYLIPVPLSSDKLRIRGYNQAEAIAIGLGKAMNIPLVTDVLVKARKTDTQTHSSKYARWINVEQIFKIAFEKSDLLEHKKVWIIDDVITTGATIESCMLHLQKINGCRTGALSLASAEHI